MKVVLYPLFFSMIGIFYPKAQNDERIEIDQDIQLLHLQDSVFVHITWDESENFGRFSSNGLIVIKNGKALMIDTPMDKDKTERLTKYLNDSMSVEVSKLIIGHFHDDCLGGLGYLQSTGVESIANFMTTDKCKELGLPAPSTSFADTLAIDFYGEQIICRYFGAGHSFDNITVWIPGKNLLFGGCMVRSANATGLGNLSDANVEEWDKTVAKVIKKYPEVKTVIPGHGSVGSSELLTRTVELVEEYRNQTK